MSWSTSEYDRGPPMARHAHAASPSTDSVDLGPFLSPSDPLIDFTLSDDPSTASLTSCPSECLTLVTYRCYELRPWLFEPGWLSHCSPSNSVNNDDDSDFWVPIDREEDRLGHHWEYLISSHLTDDGWPRVDLPRPLAAHMEPALCAYPGARRDALDPSRRLKQHFGHPRCGMCLATAVDASVRKSSTSPADTHPATAAIMAQSLAELPSVSQPIPHHNQRSAPESTSSSSPRAGPTNKMTHNRPYAQTNFPCLLQEEEGEWIWVPRKTITPATTTPVNHQIPTFRSFSAGSIDPQVSAPTMPWALSPQAVSPTYSPLGSDVSSMPNGSPTEPILDGFDLDSVFRMGPFPGYIDPSWAAPVPEANPVFSDFFANMNWMDADLFSGLDLSQMPDFPPATADVSPSVYGNQSVSDPSSPPLPPLTPASLPSTAASPASGSPITPALAHFLPFPDASGTPLFSAPGNHLRHHHKDNINTPPPSRPRKHDRKNRQLSFCCPLPHCGKGHPDKRALARHLWAQHPDLALQSNARSEKVKCTHPGCGYEGRKDNFKRHMLRHERKAGRC
ncbi:hypothetical protein N658DRAFT_561196 [Parathielavia hyrcaniae]|uniref:C2H2-type domain-containing protein n=1 Tax=Parathielavia hyrcaniae TaxID=113614 RepID=A0AAN6SYZ7_9PEZI|nr:hypothetical protein N658DRAFT_561196 [Parathielavia hyrcaniae]